MNREKSELDPKQVFNFIVYQFDLKEDKVRPTPERWQALTIKIRTVLSGVSGLTVCVPNRSTLSNRKTSPPRYKITQFADDTTIILDGERDSLQLALNVLEMFGSVSGLKMNTDRPQ